MPRKLITKVCERCGKEYTTRYPNQKYCSSSCSSSSRKYKIKCEYCGVEYISGFKNGRYCSSKCEYLYKKKHDLIYVHTCICKHCGKEFKSNIKKGKYCSVDCMKEETMNKELRFKCENCGKEFYGRKDRSNKFCSRKCYCERLNIKEVNVNTLEYQSRISDLQHIRKAKRLGVKYEKIDPLEIYEKSNWTCGICGEKIDKNLNYPEIMSASLDHIIPFSKGGTHTKENVRASHLHCNISRGNKLTESEIKHFNIS